MEGIDVPAVVRPAEEVREERRAMFRFKDCRRYIGDLNERISRVKREARGVQIYPDIPTEIKEQIEKHFKEGVRLRDEVKDKVAAKTEFDAVRRMRRYYKRRTSGSRTASELLPFLQAQVRAAYVAWAVMRSFEVTADKAASLKSSYFALRIKDGNFFCFKKPETGVRVSVLADESFTFAQVLARGMFSIKPTRDPGILPQRGWADILARFGTKYGREVLEQNAV